ncbi:hypothetical protein ACLKA6_007175 [Drosophila palustris]
MLPWTILIHLRDKAMGVYLRCNDDSDSKSNWSCHAVAKVSLVSRGLRSKIFTRHELNHLHKWEDEDSGYFNFISRKELDDFIENDSITLTVHIKAAMPKGIPWDSKKHTGYIGLKGRDKPSYLNSVLLTLYFTNSLRLAVYRMKPDMNEHVLGFQLQRLFHELQFGNRAVGTRKLQMSDSLPLNAHIFLDKLLRELEHNMMENCPENTILGLFSCKMSAYIKLKNMKQIQEPHNISYGIQFNITEHTNIYDSFRKFQICGTQADNGVIFTSFPPVLHIHLQRSADTHRFEFYEEINLDAFLAERENTPADYVLQAVLVPDQTANYKVFISPKADGRWFKFADGVVFKCRKDEAIEQNYGGNNVNVKKSIGTPYMLVYIRQSELKCVLIKIPENMIIWDLMKHLNLKHRTGNNVNAPIHVMLGQYFESQSQRYLMNMELAWNIWKNHILLHRPHKRMRMMTRSMGQISDISIEQISDSSKDVDKLIMTNLPP